MKIGTLIECVNGNFLPDSFMHIPNRPVRGQHYMIRDIFNVRGSVGVLLEEVLNPHVTSRTGKIHEPSFKVERFREIIGLDQAVERLLEESMLVDI